MDPIKLYSLVLSLTQASPPRLLSFTLDNWPVLGGPVTIDLTDRVAVLVGRNGAGKSAILEGFEFIASTATGDSRSMRRLRTVDFDAVPMGFKANIHTAEGRRLAYQYELLPHSSLADDPELDQLDEETSEGAVSFNDQCQYLDSPQTLCWQTQRGVLNLPASPENTQSIFLSSTSALSQVRASRYRSETSPEHQNLLPKEMNTVLSALSELLLVGTDPVRQSVRRTPLYRSRKNRGVWYPNQFALNRLSNRLLRFIETEGEHELQSLIRSLGLGQEIYIEEIGLTYAPQRTAGIEDQADTVQAVLVDGVNIGLLSDGTLRVLILLMDLLTSKPGSTVMIEEPEGQVHPGLLEQLLSVMESYTDDKNLILTTHSPQVVSWAKPHQINLVYRKDNQTSVRKLTEAEVERVGGYLNEAGSLGEWIYSGLLDDEDA